MAFPQEGPPGILRDHLEQALEQLAEQSDGSDDVDLTELTEQLQDLLEQPIDPRRADARALAPLRTLDNTAIEALLSHVERHGPLLDIHELQAIHGWNARTVALFRPFFRVEGDAARSATSLREALRKGTHEWTLRGGYTLEQRRGFQATAGPFRSTWAAPDQAPLLPNEAQALRDAGRLYLGSPYKLYTRYRFRYRRNIAFGITAEKDEGEEFFRGSQRQGFDFYSAHVAIRHRGNWRTIVLGDFQAQFGQGLTFWSGLAFSNRSALTMSIKRHAPGLSPYASVNENLFLRGAGATWAQGRWEATLFASHKAVDANAGIVNDSTEALFSAFQQDGFHRTTTELAKKDAVRESIAGTHLRYSTSHWSVGGTAVGISYDHALQSDLRPYSSYQFQGRSNALSGIDWQWRRRNLSTFGEAARSANGGMAMVAGALAALHPKLGVSLLYRDLQRDFHGTHSSALAAHAMPWNERGLYFGIEARPSTRVTMNAYADQYRAPWLRFRADAPPAGHDLLAQIVWAPARNTRLSFRFRDRVHERNAAAEQSTRPLYPAVQRNLRFHVDHRISPSVSYRGRVETVSVQHAQERHHGLLLYHDLVHRPLNSRLQFTGRVAFVRTSDHAARLYAFETEMVGVYSMPAYHGNGMRWYGMVRYSVARGLDIWVRYGAWHYRDRGTIGSGLQAINGTRQSEVRIQLRWRWG